MRTSGNTGRDCLRDYVEEIETCRLATDASCETAARADGGPIDQLLARTAEDAATKCTDAAAFSLGYLDVDDVQRRIPEACSDFGDDLLDLGVADSTTGALVGCQSAVAQAVDHLRNTVVRAFGHRCYLAELAGERCNRRERDRGVARARKHARGRIVDRCGDAFDALRLVAPDAAPTLPDRVDALLGIIVQRSRHFAQCVFPPNDLGPTARFGPFPIGVRTLALTDPSRL